MIYNKSNTFHVLVQGMAKSYVFNFEKDKSVYLNYLTKALAKNNVSLLAYCVMGNHAHMLLNTEEAERISKAMYEVNKSYARYYNAERIRVGYVFRNRFRAEAITGEEYLVKCIGYIHNNPVKAGMVNEANEYKYSSARSYETRKGIADWQRLNELIGNIPISQDSREQFIDDEYEGNMEPGEAIEAAMIELQIGDARKIDSDEKLAAFVTSVRSKTKVSLRELANILELNRERLRRLMSSITSP